MTTTMTRPPLTATQIIHGVRGAESLERGFGASFPTHPALAVLAWEDERTDVHGVGCRWQGRETDDGPSLVWFACHCGFETAKCAAETDAIAELVEHALKSCAVCHGPKPAGNFPRCSGCAF